LSLGDDIKEVYEEIGMAVTILRAGGDISGEYIDSEPDAGTSFIRRAFFPATTQAVPGDIIEIPAVGGGKYLVVLLIPDVFEDSPFEYGSLLYQCNFQGRIERLSQARNTSYQLEMTESDVANPAYAFRGASDFSLSFEGFGTVEIRKGEIYFPASYIVKAMDRFVTASGASYRIGSVDGSRYEGVGTAMIEKDVR